MAKPYLTGGCRVQLGYGLAQVQKLKLALTPQLRQSLAVLQLSAVDLVAFLQQQADENPLLNVDARDELAWLGDEERRAEARGEPTEDDAVDWAAYLEDPGFRESAAAWSEDEDPLARATRSDKTLFSVLAEQLRYASVSEPVRRAALFLAGNLTDAGYLDVSLEEAAAASGTDVVTMRQALDVLQSLDPPGVGARDLRECLLLQLARLEPRDALAEAIVRDHLEDLAAHRLGRIAAALGVHESDVQRAVDRIRALNPKPGLAYASDDVRYIVPDVFVERVSGEYVVILNDRILPRITINAAYRRLLSDSADRDARRYVEERLNAALWVVRSVEQRRLTLFRVTQAIVQRQRDFLDYGIARLKPLTLRDIAEMTGLHESTVSRATANKYVQTPRGLFAFKFFFGGGVETASGAASAESVKARIRALIEGEDKKRPLSDQKLADLLAQEGIAIARRTVAKYREELGIPPSSKRRRYD
ncbi:RNA polymerase factor sigma-54 [Calditerricola satsumensis]|uniref:RNA polymerase sigma-54 factor n=1 Tax=Calditerricola satsumensis TaxID=373054 RepID=A0A8J3BBV8_9BACI|nr:RNA polymerase factor sigma-54 [Calditerricola satsumensis]GGK02483.1 RNA polymerase sigma-54 factor [Calditerricola satsumensis]